MIAGRSWTLLGLIGVIAVLVNFAYLSPRTQALRWLTPGLVFLLLFLVWPLVYTTYVSLTNYQTGNVLSKQQVIDQLERQVIQSTGEGVDFRLDVYQDGAGQLAFLLTDPAGTQLLRNSTSPHRRTAREPAARSGRRLAPPTPMATACPSRSATTPSSRRWGGFRLANQLENLVLDIPGQGIAQVQTTTAARLVAGGSRYIYDPATDTLFDVQENVTCVVEEGNFVCPDGRRLDPGFQDGGRLPQLRRPLHQPSAAGSLLQGLRMEHGVRPSFGAASLRRRAALRQRSPGRPDARQAASTARC